MMVTGDHPATAQAIARLVHIPASPVLTGQQVDALDDRELAEQLRTTHVFARVTPLHKLRIVTALQGEHQTVAMTGDGVNDAPALKAADVGVAMGQRGSDVSREVADLVLMDDNFATIVAAIEEGRGIYENIQKFIRTLFSTNLSEVLLIATGALLAFAFSGEGAELFLPLAAVQILWMNLLTDSFPALALATDQNPGVMALPPRPSAAPLLDRASVIFVVVGGVLGGLVGLVLLLQLPAIGYSLPQTRSVVFCFLVFVQLAFVLPARRVHWNPPFNPLVWLAVSMTAGAQLLAIALPGLRQMLQMEPLEWSSVWLVIASTAACWLAVEATSWYLRRAARASLG